MRTPLFAAAAALVFFIPAFAQEQPNPKTLIPQSTIEAIVDEVSGSLAFQHILELDGYEHDRLEEEYKTTLREAAYVEKTAKRLGLEDVHIERFKGMGKTWDGEVGELWMLEPQKRLVISYRDVPASLASGSQNGDVTAQLIYVGRGESESDYTGKDVSGKIVLASGSPAAVHSIAVRKLGAAGVVSFNNPTGKPIDRPDQFAWNGISRGFGPGGSGAKTTFGFNLSHRIGMELLELLEGGKRVMLRARVKATEYDTDMQAPTAVIRGTGSEQEIALAAHLFEGIAKQGAMDNASGSALLLEVARAWMKLIHDGVLPRPRRTVRFLWIPEIVGTMQYLQRFPGEARRMVAAVAVDMAGEDVKQNRNSLHLMRTPYSTPSFVNEVLQQFYEYVGDTNREKIHNRRIAYGPRFPILDPQGSRDPFYYDIDKHYGASDHAVFLSSRIPAVMMNNWPDISYHTNEDAPYRADLTQLKRAVFICLASAHAMASADGPGAARIAELTAGYGAERTGRELRLALQMVGEAGTKNPAGARREALNLVKQAYAREGEAIRSAKVLAESDAQAPVAIEALARAFVEGGEPAASSVRAYSRALAGDVVDWTPGAVENEAASLIPIRKKAAPGFGGGGGRGGMSAPLTGFNAQEARAFADGKRSVLDIRDAVSAEFEPLETASVLAFFRQLEKSGEFELKAR
jgi:aminopeptidase YwaD